MLCGMLMNKDNFGCTYLLHKEQICLVSFKLRFHQLRSKQITQHRLSDYFYGKDVCCESFAFKYTNFFN